MPSVQLALIDRLSTHHDPLPSLKASRKRNYDFGDNHEDFFNSIDPNRTCRDPRPWPPGRNVGFWHIAALTALELNDRS